MTLELEAAVAVTLRSEMPKADPTTTDSLKPAVLLLLLLASAATSSEPEGPEAAVPAPTPAPDAAPPYIRHLG